MRLKVLNTSDIKSAMVTRLEQHRKKQVLTSIAGIMDQVLSEFPTEDGHAHAAWLSALEQEGSDPDIAETIGRHLDKSSNDFTANTAGNMEVAHGGSVSKATVTNSLPFVSKVESGGLLKPIQPGGFKSGGPRTAGKLYAARGSVGKGFLRLENGSLVPQIQLTGLRIVQKVLSQFRQRHTNR